MQAAPAWTLLYWKSRIPSFELKKPKNPRVSKFQIVGAAYIANVKDTKTALEMTVNFAPFPLPCSMPPSNFLHVNLSTFSCPTSCQHLSSSIDNLLPTILNHGLFRKYELPASSRAVWHLEQSNFS